MRERQRQVRSAWAVILVVVFSLVLSLPVIPQSSPLGIPQARAAVSYSRTSAQSYAACFWNKVVSDGYYFSDAGPKFFGPGTGVGIVDQNFQANG